MPAEPEVAEAADTPEAPGRPGDQESVPLAAVEAPPHREPAPDEYERTVRETFRRLKSATTWPDAVANAVPIREGFGYLVPACELHAGDRRLIETLTHWREENQAVFPTRFPTSPERTAAWLREQVLDVDDRILFLVHDAFGRLVGHMGLAQALNEERAIKPDNVIRGVGRVSPSLMVAAFVSELTWAAEVLRPRVFRAVVLRENPRTLMMIKHVGFREAGTIPLRAEQHGDHVVHTPVAESERESADTHWIVLELDPAELRGPR